MSYRNLDTYVSPQELAELKNEHDRKEKTKRVLLNNLKLKTLYDPFSFAEELAESQADSKFSRKTIQQKAEISADNQFDVNTNVNFIALQDKINQMIDVINKCCKGANLDGLFLDIDDKNTLKLKFLEFYYALQQGKQDEKRLRKTEKKEDRKQNKTKRAHRDRLIVEEISVAGPKLSQTLNTLIRRLLNLNDNLVFFEMISAIGKKISEKTPLSEEDELILNDLRELYMYSKTGKGSVKSLKIMIELIFGFILNYNDGDGMKIKFRYEYGVPYFGGIDRYRAVLNEKIRKSYIEEVFKRMGFTASELKQIFTNALIQNPTPEKELQLLVGFGSKKRKPKKPKKSKKPKKTIKKKK